MDISEKVTTFAAAKRKGKFNFQLTFLSLDKMRARSLLFSLNRKVGRVIDRAGLEIRYTPFGYRGFESLTFRKDIAKGSHTVPFSDLKKRYFRGVPDVSCTRSDGVLRSFR